MPWKLQDAKQRFSELVRMTLTEGPQTVTRHGEEVVVIVAAAEYWRSQSDGPDFADFLLNGPDLDALDLSRSGATSRDVEL